MASAFGYFSFTTAVYFDLHFLVLLYLEKSILSLIVELETTSPSSNNIQEIPPYIIATNRSIYLLYTFSLIILIDLIF